MVAERSRNRHTPGTRPSETEIAITNDNTTQVASLGHLIVDT